MVVHVGRRLRSLVQLSNAHSWIWPRSNYPATGVLSQGALARKAARVFLARAGAQGLTIATRKAAEGTRAHFVACDSFLLLLFRRIQFFMSIFAPPCPKVATKCAKLGCSDRCELDVDMVDQAEATPGLSGALLAAPWRACVRRAQAGARAAGRRGPR